MSYKVLALKYRPLTFDEVVGQPHVTTTLVNAITANRVAHAILFTGPRGTGKTTIARILARAMNCSRGPSPTPCNQCKICTDIIEGHSSDVFEIDGASNNSVDQIRDLRENVLYMPAAGAYKIYIIDEVHMLSTAAFNALLKTLEEPPDHVMFFFATTEVHKIPATILSRCQRHDLGRISLEHISLHLEKICKKEGFDLGQESLDLISLEADGSIRDSLSLLDRILSAYPDKAIGYENVKENLGVMDRTLMHDLSAAVFQKDGAALIRLVEIVDDAGLDLKKFYSDMILHFRNLNVIKLCGPENPFMNLTDKEKKNLAQAVAKLTPLYLGMLLQLLLNEESLVKFSSHTKTAVEMILLKLIQINPDADLDPIIDRLDLLARHLDSKLTDLPPPLIPSALPELPNPPQVPVQAQIPVQPQEKTELTVSSHNSPPTWSDFLNTIEKNLPFIFALFSKGQVDDTKPALIQVKLHQCSAFDKSRLETKKQELEALCSELLGKKLEISFKDDKENGPDKTSIDLKARQAARHHPLVLDAERIFNGEIIN